MSFKRGFIKNFSSKKKIEDNIYILIWKNGRENTRVPSLRNSTQELSPVAFLLLWKDPSLHWEQKTSRCPASGSELVCPVNADRQSDA